MNILIRGSNRGFGLELCKVALAAGHTVIAGMRQTTELSAEVKALQANYPIRVLAVHPGWMRTDMGGASAVTDPADQAEQCLRLITGETFAEEGHYLVRVDGSAMPF